MRLTGHEGRKIFMTGELTGSDGEGGTATFTRATATFIAIDPELFRAAAEPAGEPRP